MARHLAFLIVLVSAVLLLAGCPPASLTDQGFFVICKIDGVEVSLGAGPSGIANLQAGGTVTLDGIPSGFTDSGPNTTVLASIAAIDMTGGPDFPSEPGAFRCVVYSLSDVGSFTITNGGTGGLMQFTTADGLTIYSTNDINATINGTITTFESVGGVIEGTFSGNLYDQSVGASHPVTEGSFRIKRYEAFDYQSVR